MQVPHIIKDTQFYGGTSVRESTRARASVPCVSKIEEYLPPPPPHVILLRQLPGGNRMGGGVLAPLQL